MKKKIDLVILYIYLASLVIQTILLLVSSWLPSRINIVLVYCLAILALVMVIVHVKTR